jgi:hypothetical protein
MWLNEYLPVICRIPEYIIRKLSVSTNSTLLYKLVQIVRFADDINIMARTFKAAKETFEELTWKANEIGFIANENKTKGMVQFKNTQKTVVQRGQYEIEMVNKFIYLGNMINDTNTENQEIQKRINYANGIYSL